MATVFIVINYKGLYTYENNLTKDCMTALIYIFAFLNMHSYSNSVLENEIRLKNLKYYSFNASFSLCYFNSNLGPSAPHSLVHTSNYK